MSKLTEKIEIAEEYLKTPLAELASRKNADMRFYRACCFIPESDDEALDRYSKLFEDITISCVRVSAKNPDGTEAESYYKMTVDCSYLDKVSMYVTGSAKLNYPYFVYPVVSEFNPKLGFDMFKDETEIIEIFRKNPMIDLMFETFSLEGEMNLNINKLHEVPGYDKAIELIEKYKSDRETYLDSLYYTEEDLESRIPYMV